MNIIVCIKQVPGSTEIQINPETNTLMRDSVEAVINPFDLYALEEGLRLKERYGGTVTVLSMGPAHVESALREALSYGVDEAVMITDRAFAGADTLATALTLSAAIRTLGEPDLILMGRQAIDGDTGQVGPSTAENLSVPHVTEVRKIESIEQGVMVVQRMLEDGYLRMAVALPAVVTVVKEINEPRPASFKGKLRARQAQIRILGAQDLGISGDSVGLNGSPTRVMKIFSPPKPTGGKVFNGDARSAVAELIAELKNAGVGLKKSSGG